MFQANLHRLRLGNSYNFSTVTKMVEGIQYPNVHSSEVHVDFYYKIASPPSRTVILTATALGIKLNFIHVNTLTKEHLRPEYLKMNPQHTIPMIVDDGIVLWESRSISRYLVNKFGGDSSLYPKDPKARALVDHRLDFDLGTLYQTFADYYYPQLFKGVPANKATFKYMLDALKICDLLLKDKEYAAGSELTIADFALVTTISNMEATGIEITNFANIMKWYQQIKSISPYYEDIIQKWVEESKKYISENKVNK